MAQLSEQILKYLSENEEINTLDLAKFLHDDHQKIVGALKSIQANGDLVLVDPITEKCLEVTDEGKIVAEHGSHEANIYRAIPESGIAQANLMKLPNAKVGFSKAMSNGWILVDKNTNPPLVLRKVEEIVDVVQEHLKQVILGNVTDISEKERQELKKRKLIQEVVTKSFNLRKGPEFSVTLTKLETDLTTEMLMSGSWQRLKFKEYNFDALGVPPDCGYLHPLLKVRSEFRQIFLEMGFSEMPTNNYIENSFWNFDALFQPQQHPARDAHDTFFISHPKISSKFPQDYLERVRKVHSKGGYGSQGYGYDWKIEEAQKNLLRTHTTAVSARMLYKIAQQKEFRPIKLFSIDKVFRNETLDATHLAEFHQVEGVIADFNLTLGDLIGVFAEFFRKLGVLLPVRSLLKNIEVNKTKKKLNKNFSEFLGRPQAADGKQLFKVVKKNNKFTYGGLHIVNVCAFPLLVFMNQNHHFVLFADGITQLEFKPAYNPYTEPSMEIFCFHPGLGKWIEIGNSGMFRPEMLLPMGLPEDVCVIAWGLSLERPTMIKYGFNNIRDLVGPKVDLEMVQKTPICRLNK